LKIDTSLLSALIEFCALELIFGSTEVVGSRFDVLRSQTCFRRYRGRQVAFSCFACPNLFSAVPTASSPVFMYCAPGLVFDGIEGVGSRFHVLRVETHFQRYQRCQITYSCFALPDSLSAVPRALGTVFLCVSRPDPFSVVPRVSGPFFMFCAPGLVFGGTVGISNRFHVLCARTHFRRYRGRRVTFSFFCEPELIFGGTNGVGSCIHVLRSRTHFPRYRGRRVPFSCVSCTEPFSAIPRASYVGGFKNIRRRL
jgi:hypothetical protein